MNWGIIDLSTNGDPSWSTARTSSPGYFSAIGSATYTNSSDNFNVNGYVKHYADAANQGFTYPVGTGTDLRTLSISGTIPASAVYTTAWIVGNPSTQTDPTAPNSGTHSTSSYTSPIVAVNTSGMWDWQDVSGNSNGITVTVSMPDLSSFSLPNNLRIVGWNGTGWVDLSGMSTASGNTENSTVSGTMINGITAIGIGTTNIGLPIHFLDFTAVRINEKDVTLKWKMNEDEAVLDHYVPEYSIDGSNFMVLENVIRQGNLSGIYQYNYTHLDARSLNVSKIYYRIKIVNTDQTTDYSMLRIVNINGQKDEVILFPNIAEGNITATNLQNASSISIYNSIGVFIRAYPTGQKPELDIDLSSITSGNYMMNIEFIDGTFKVFKFIIAR